MQVVIMAGGRGQRLDSLTDHTPKPMLHVGTKPMLEQLIEDFVAQGFPNITLTTHYLSDVIRKYFEFGHKWGADITYVDEVNPMGTAGALSLCAHVDTIVCNADIITKIDFKDLALEHQARVQDATMCVASYKHQIPYGVLHMKDGHVDFIEEKPIKDYWVSAGINVISGKVIAGLAQERLDMPDLLDMLKLVSIYEIEGYWQDVGTWETYKEVNR